MWENIIDTKICIWILLYIESDNEMEKIRWGYINTKFWEKIETWKSYVKRQMGKVRFQESKKKYVHVVSICVKNI